MDAKNVLEFKTMITNQSFEIINLNDETSIEINLKLVNYFNTYNFLKL